MINNKKFNIKLEQYHLNELTEDVDNVELSPEDKEYIEYIENDNQEFFKKFDIDKLAKETTNKVSNGKKIVSFPVKTVSTLVAAAACFLITLNLIPSNIDKEVIYLKGKQEINIYLKDGDNINKLNNLDPVLAKTQLQITYNSHNSYGVIFSLDGLNNITFHYPEDSYSTTKMDIGKEVTLPTSYTLDNAPYFEKFYMITSKDSFDLKLVKKAISQIKVENGNIIRDLDLPKTYQIDVITLLKD